MAAVALQTPPLPFLIGQKLINEIKIGDNVLSFTATPEVLSTSIQAVFVHYINEYIELHVGKTLLNVTDEHPFFIGNANFSLLQKLGATDCIYTLVDGSLQSTFITSMKLVVAPATLVYNLHTAETNAYFANGIAVHNKLLAEFVDLSNSKGLKRIEWSSYAPDWRIARPGLCLEGTCTNKDCKAQADKVVINIGFK